MAASTRKTAVEKMAFVWRDVSDVVGIEAEADRDPDLRLALINLGFRSVGCVERQMPWLSEKKTTESMNKIFEESDVEVLTRTRWVQEILASPDGRALATVGGGPGGPVVNFRSVFERGWIVDTSSKPPHAPRYRRNLFGLVSRLATGGLQHIGTRANSGYFAQIEPLSVSELWELHKKRVQSVLRGNGGGLRSHDNVAVYVAGSYHVHRMYVFTTESSERFNRLLVLVGRVLLVLLGLFLCVVSIALYWTGWASPLVVIPALGLAFLGLLGMLIFASWVFHRHVLPGLRGPRPMMLDELLKEIGELCGVSVGDQGAA